MNDIPGAYVAQAGSALIEPGSLAVATDLDDSFFETRRLCEGGWDGARKSKFIGTLAETGVVTFACRACGMSAKAAYALRHRDPLFGKAWETALDMARHRLADELLARALKGSAEQLLRDGCIVGERHHYDNKLAFAILRRLDRQAELGVTFRTPPAAEIPQPAPATRGQWQALLDAIEQSRDDDAATLLGSARREHGNSQGNDPPIEGGSGTDVHNNAPPDPRIWWESGRQAYRTNFPPPEGQSCDENGQFGHRDYHRALTDAEAATMTARDAASAAKHRAVAEAERDVFFAADVKSSPDP